MQLAEITSYIQTILPLIHGEKDWCAWVFMQETAFCVTRNKQRPQTLEERILMRNLNSQLPSPSISITSSHLCFQFITENSNKINQLYCIKTKEVELVIAGKAVSELQIELIQSGFQQEARKMQLKKQSIHMIHRLQENQQRLQQELEHYKNLKNSSIQTQINQWILQQSQEIIVSPAVIDLLQQSLTPIAVNSVLDQALRLALYLKIDSNTTLTLLPEHIELEIEEQKSVQSNRLQNRAELLLDKYEMSAQQIDLKKGIITGRTLAEHLDPPVSPPAITDAIKKNRKAIAQAMQENPDRWLLIRNYLKPLKDLDFQLSLRSI